MFLLPLQNIIIVTIIAVIVITIEIATHTLTIVTCYKSNTPQPYYLIKKQFDIHLLEL